MNRNQYVPAALLRSIVYMITEKYKPALTVDEIRTVFGRIHELREVGKLLDDDTRIDYQDSCTFLECYEEFNEQEFISMIHGE